MPMPPWVKSTLVAQGKITSEGISRAARARRCKRCHAVVMAGLDDDYCASVVQCDPAPIDALGEVAALLAHRRTFTITRVGGHYELDERCAVKIDAHSADELEVLAAHVCGQPLPPAVRKPGAVGRWARPYAPNSSTAHESAPPF